MKKLVLLIFCFAIAYLAYGQKLQKNLQNAHKGAILSVAVNNDGTLLISSDDQNRAYVWDVKKGEKLKALAGHTGAITHVAFSPDNKSFLTAGDDGKVIIWDIKKFSPIGILKDHTKAVLCAEYNPINNNIVSGSEDNSIIVWDGGAHYKLMSLDGHSKAVNDISISSDGNYVVSGSADDMVIIWDVNSGEKLQEINAVSKGVNTVAFSADGRFVASGGKNGKVFIWDASTGNKLVDFDELNSPVNEVVFSPDVQYLAGVADNGKTIIWDIALRQVVKDFAPHTNAINSIVFSDKGNVMVTAGADMNIKIWDVANLNIGKKKFVEDIEKPYLTCSPLILEEKEKNGIIETTDIASLSFIVSNEGKGQAYDVVAKVTLDPPVLDLMYDKEYYLGNLGSGKNQKIKINIYPGPQMETAISSFKVSVFEANGNNAEPVDLAFQTKGSSNAFIMIADFAYSSATGKAEVGSPITLKLYVKNASNTEAKNITVKYILPENVMAVDKLMETVDVFQPNELKELRMQFYANENFNLDKLDMKVEIDGAAFTNLENVDLAINMNEELPVNKEVFIAEATAGNQPIFRGDALKGVDMYSAQKEMEIGEYYALIIGIDKYKGHWTPLQNAVGDAKAVEGVLKAKYKFDYFKTLYDEQATRDNIIKEMEWLVSNVRSKDNVLIYYSGHGDFKQQLNKGYWVPVDATTNSTSDYISNSDLQTFLAGIASKHTLLISDACFSGDIFRGKTVGIPFENSDKYYQKVNDLASRQAITSGGIEPVMDGGRDGHSVFAYYLLKTL
ncbi:MAG: caspase family protein, partial [Bacteroidales bacterium]|nr:caspase family protein [Bacteroidales bacterium]